MKKERRKEEREREDKKKRKKERRSTDGKIESRAVACQHFLKTHYFENKYANVLGLFLLSRSFIILHQSYMYKLVSIGTVILEKVYIIKQ